LSPPFPLSALRSYGFDLEPLAVPAAPGRALLQASPSSGGYGGYGSNGGYGGYGGGSAGRRRLQERSGGYGAYGGNGGYGGYGGASRALLEQSEAGLQPEDPALLAAEQQRRAGAVLRQAGGEGVSAAAAAAARGGRAAAAASLLAPPAGACYCRYDADYNTWALGEEPCKAALRAKCGAGQLPCGWLDGYYGHALGGAMAHTLPHEADILAFVFDDCQPRPPCACAGVKFDGSDTVTSAFACCRDLRAACRTPFNGLACGDVDAFCKDDAPSAKLLHWAQHKLHRAGECAAYAGLPYDFVSLPDIVAANRAAAPRDALAAALTAAPGAAAAGGRVATAAVALGGVLVGVALVGMVATLRASGDAGDADADAAAAPLLHAVPELAAHPEQARPALHHVVSSNYMLGSVPPSHNASNASLSSAQQ
jgi:hypothetical protein